MSLCANSLLIMSLCANSLLNLLGVAKICSMSFMCSMCHSLQFIRCSSFVARHAAHQLSYTSTSSSVSCSARTLLAPRCQLAAVTPSASTTTYLHNKHTTAQQHQQQSRLHSLQAYNHHQEASTSCPGHIADWQGGCRPALLSGEAMQDAKALP